MSDTTIPAIGDEFEYSVLVSECEFWYEQGREDGHRHLGFKPGVGLIRECDPDNTRSCPKCFDQWEVRTSTVTDLAYYMDNSIEVRLADGARRTIVAPHGDACY